MDEEKVWQYLRNEKGNTEIVAERLIEKVEKYEDIAEEFGRWLEERDYEAENPVTVNGYTAKQIYELAPGLDGIGVYNFLVTLRDDPESVEEIIANNFMVK